jgi:hypothetical protein
MCRLLLVKCPGQYRHFHPAISFLSRNKEKVPTFSDSAADPMRAVLYWVPAYPKALSIIHQWVKSLQILYMHGVLHVADGTLR